MAWGQQSQPPPADGKTADGQKRQFAVPPACPRCELTKAQMNRTIQNYQKAYRKKVEGLKQELISVRADNSHLRAQVRRLRRKRWVHAPSIAVGAALGGLALRLAQRLWQRRQQQAQQPGAGSSSSSGGVPAAEQANGVSDAA